MIKITVSEEIHRVAPAVCLWCIAGKVVYQQQDGALWDEIVEKVKFLAGSLKTDDIGSIPAIGASRKVYRACGKDPARYRLSAEALLRRVVGRGEIYQTCNMVDALNLVSISTGFSIGGYDMDKISGDVSFGIGKQGEPYEGIGRGELNIESMPVFRDQVGAFGTSTSDSVRTSVTGSTTRFLMVIVDYDGQNQGEKAVEMAVALLKKYAQASEIQINTIEYVKGIL